MEHTHDTPASNELRSGILLSLFAAALALTDLASGKFGDDEIIAINEKANHFAWQQSKSIKESLVEGQIDLLQTLLEAGAIHATQRAPLVKLQEKFKKEANRYRREKKEILLGSQAVGPDGWAQEIDGKLGQITGAKLHEARAQALGKVGDFYDLATLFLQLSLVIGAISLMLREPSTKHAFLIATLVLGVLGTAVSLYATRCAFLVA